MINDKKDLTLWLGALAGFKPGGYSYTQARKMIKASIQRAVGNRGFYLFTEDWKTKSKALKITNVNAVTDLQRAIKKLWTSINYVSKKSCKNHMTKVL